MRGDGLAIPGHTRPHLGAEGVAAEKIDQGSASNPGHTWPYLIAIRGTIPQQLQLEEGMARYGHLQKVNRTCCFLVTPLGWR